MSTKFLTPSTAQLKCAGQALPNARDVYKRQSFTEDVKEISRQMLIVHDSSDNTLKPSKKALRKRGKICHTADGDTIYQQGDTARASLHKQTYYGAINLNGDIKYVLRVPVDSLKEKDIDKIVDPAVKRCV